ncbi:MAG TPA: hypothetical protein VN436_13490 [Holophaga sp.]|nr:hypothetical protein [Holophaga sp.]
MAVSQVVAFVVGLIGIECNRRGLLPPVLARMTPMSHFYAINLAFTLVLIQEVVDLIFVLPCSVTKSLGKQFEVLCLILLRDAFKELVHLHEPIILVDSVNVLLPMLTYGAGALLVFMGLGLYYRRYRARAQGPAGPWLYPFVAFKKFLAFCLLFFFLAYGLWMTWQSANDGTAHDFFAVFYTVLIFSDMFIVLLSHTYQPAFRSVFRNSGFALATLLIRFALAAPAYYAPLLGVSAIAFAYGVSLTSDMFEKDG